VLLLALDRAENGRKKPRTSIFSQRQPPETAAP
jgi:hypothetical protein